MKGGVTLTLLASAVLGAIGCGTKVKADLAAEAPPAVQVEREPEGYLVTVDHPERFPVVSASGVREAPSLVANGVVAADISRQTPVVALASGRVIEVDARLGDTVHKGQVLMRVQSADISAAFAEYEKAMAAQNLARSQLERSKELNQKGALSQKDLEISENDETVAQVTERAAAERLRVLGGDAGHPGGTIDIPAPVSGIITEQNVAAAGGVKSLDASPNLFTISDLSQVWIVCDVYENDLPQIRLGEYGEIRLAAYPGLVVKGHVSDIGPMLDPAIRSAKVRVQVANPGMLRVGMFVTATFHGLRTAELAAVPASAVLHLHDRDWIYVPAGNKRFRRIGVIGGNMLTGNIQEIASGIGPGQRVVSNALLLQNTVEQ